MMNSMYDPLLVAPMERQLEMIGVKPLKSEAEVDTVFPGKSGTTMLVINSVCGCAAGTARPGVALALQNEIIPDNLMTVFAGVDLKATARARKHLTGVPPSSPSVAILKDGKLVYMLHRQEIEGATEEKVADRLKEAFTKYCTAAGPSVEWSQVLKAFDTDNKAQDRVEP